MSEALADYERRRNEMAMPDYRQNLREARFEPLPADARHLFTAIQGNQEETNRFLMAKQGMIPAEEFFNPANLERIMGKARNG